MSKRSGVLIIACGVLAREIVALIRANQWQHMTVQCLPAEWHNTPDKIPNGVRNKIRDARDRFARIFVAYADCGTGGQLDQVLKEEGVERISGAHCYEFFAGAKTFAELSDAEPGTFYLTDFLAQHFDRLIYRGLGLDRHPQLMSDYFGNYRKLVYLAQMEKPRLVAKAREVAKYLDLEFEYRFSGYGDLGRALIDLNGKTTAWLS